MATRSADYIRKVTRELGAEFSRELDKHQDLDYPPFPHESGEHLTWRLRLDLTDNSKICGGIDLNDEVILGRDQNIPGFAALLEAVDIEQLGVSRRHALLRPTESKLYLIDMGSTNQSWINGHSIGVNMPYSLNNGDVVRLGRLEFTLNIVKHPQRTTVSQVKSDPFENLPAIARSITSQLTVKDVLKQTLVMVMTYMPSDEVSIWLVDEHSGELFLETEQGMDDQQVNRLPVADSLAGQVVRTGQPAFVNRERDGDQIKIKTGYLVEAVSYVPLTLGGATFGVLSAAHREKGKMFSQQDQKMMIAIADLTAVAVQNARMHQATVRTLANRAKVLTALNFTLSNNFKSLVNSTIGYVGLLSSDESLTSDALDIAGHIRENGDSMIELIHQLIDTAALTEDFVIRYIPFDLTDAINRAIEDVQGFATERRDAIDFQIMGTPYIIQGDANYIYRAVLNLVDNAVRYSPPQSVITVSVLYRHQEIIITVHDNGPGIPESDLPYLFDRYIRSEESRGIGLGLHIVRLIVEAHQGTVTAHNAADHGAEVIISLPGKLRID